MVHISEISEIRPNHTFSYRLCSSFDVDTSYRVDIDWYLPAPHYDPVYTSDSSYKNI